jgi:ABC-type tungstate transport system substrate-binding protein
MKLNVGSIDRVVRIVIGLTLVLLSAMGPLGWWGWLGVVLILTGFIRLPGICLVRIEYLLREAGRICGQTLATVKDRIETGGQHS